MPSIDLWYTTRATGLVALVLLSAVMVLGVLTAGRAGGAQPGFARADLHRRVSAVALAFLAVHVLTAALDSFVKVGLAAIFVPFASSYKPGWVALGAVGFDLLLAVGVSSILRSRIPAASWRRLHWLAYLSWPVAVAHSIGIGTDMKLAWVLALVGLCVGTVVGAAGWRVYAGRRARSRLPRTSTPPRRSLRPAAGAR